MKYAKQVVSLFPHYEILYYIKKDAVDNFMERQFLVEEGQKNTFLLSINVKHVPQADSDSCAEHVLTSTRARI